MISIDEFGNVDIRVARVLEVEDLPGARKPLYKIRLDLGELGTREVAAGIKEHYAPDQLRGKSVLVVANLEAKSIAGFLSQGMILAVDTDTGISLIVPDSDAKPGAKVR
jgi:methionine--tRNA ligase beta chain